MRAKAKPSIVIGSDEAGKGEWLGPLVIAAVAITPEQSSYLVIQGVMDSKKLRMDTILKLADIIKKNSISHYVITITPQRFNKLLLEVKREKKSLNDILAWAHAKAIWHVYEEIKERKLQGKIKVVIDEFDKLKTERRLKRILKLSELEIIQRPRAEEETAVAAASILAKATREHWLDRMSRYLHLDLRSISARDALTYDNVNLFAKVGFLNRSLQEGP